MPNPFIHIELNTTNVEKAKAFYGSLFQWSLDDMPMGDFVYTTIRVGNGTGGGMLKHPMPGAPSTWIPYVDVADVHAATQKARSLGGNLIKDVTEVPNMGWFSVVLDPTGAAIGLWQNKVG
jgi:predicted enzyme related to lactoylglutathione lyase